MSLVINTNTASLNAQRNINKTQAGLNQALQRLSSGLRINSAKDDAAGLAITSRMTAQIRGLDQGMRNANDGISIAQTAEGALGEITTALQRIRELAVQSANDTNSATDRASLQKEVAQLQQEIDRISMQTQFNGKSLLDGSFTSQKFQVGAYADQTISFTMGNSRSTHIGSNSRANYSADDVATTINAATGRGDNVAAAVNGVAAQNLTITGSLGTTNSVIGVLENEAAFSIASKINATTSQTGVEAKAITKAELSGLTATGTISLDLYGANTTAVNISANITSESDLSALAEAINGRASTTGITAEVAGGTITLTQSEGYDIKIADFTGAGDIGFRGIDANTGTYAGAAQTLLGAVDTNDSSAVGGTLMLTSANAFTVNTSVAGTLFQNPDTASDLASVSSIDIGSQLGANTAMKIADGALAFIDDLRGTLGAVQNRFTSAIANLQTTSENVSAARGRVQDADFAQETASLTKFQILQQAGIAMLSQSNQMSQTVLSLLQG